MKKRLGGILLAAGEGKRMEGLKPLLPINSTTFLECIIKKLKIVCEETIVVLGYQSSTIIKKVDLSGVKVVFNREYRKEQLSSLQAGLKEISKDTEGIIMALVDQPLVKEDTYKKLKNKFLEYERSIIIPTFGGKKGHPTIFTNFFFKELMNAPLDIGARYVIKNYPQYVITVPVKDRGVIININTPQIYNEFIKKSSLKRKFNPDSAI